jgi:molybdenum cofactor biosynthesis enzyme MoaA
MALTARVLVGLDCNLSCEYCCNNDEDVAARFTAIRDATCVKYSEYRDICVSGGEPLLNMSRVYSIVVRAKHAGCNVYLYTNGTLLTKVRYHKLLDWGVDCINVGLHQNHQTEVNRITTFSQPQRVRFDYENIYRVTLDRQYGTREWVLNECDTPGEDIYLLEGAC